MGRLFAFVEAKEVDAHHHDGFCKLRPDGQSTPIRLVKSSSVVEGMPRRLLMHSLEIN